MSLEQIRDEIDRIDDQIVGLLAQRQPLVRQAAGYKSTDAEVRACDRRARMMRRLRGRAVQLDVDPDVVERIYTTVVDAFIDLERDAHADPSGADPGGTAAQRVQRVSSGSPYEATIGFSRAVRTGGRVLVSGTGPVWPDGSCPDDAAAHARRCWQIIGEALAAAGAGLADVVRTRMFLADPAAADAVSAVHGELVGDVRPAATVVVVAGLLDPRWRVEIEAEAEVTA